MPIHTKDGLTLDEARVLANGCWLTVERDGSIHRTAYDVLRQDPPAWTVERVVDVARAVYPRSIALADRWIAHYENRLSYERAMLAEQIGDKSEDGTLAGRFDFAVGGRVLVGSDWLTILRINKADGVINSLTTAAPKGVTWQSIWNYGVERVQDYEPPTLEENARVTDALKLPPLCNYPGEGFKEMTKAEWTKRRKWSDFSYVATLAATETAGRHRVRRAPVGMMKYQQVFITDQKRIDPPAPPTSSPPVVPASQRELSTAPKVRAERHQPDTNAAVFDAMRRSLKAGVQVVAAPQLFPTPSPLAARMVELAEIEEGHTLLEPSAGTGALLDAMSVCVRPTIVEINVTLAARLRQRFDSVLNVDFLECGQELGLFDRIMMNPPFVNGADIRHIQHAARMLAPGGRLVALCAAGPRQTEALRPMAEHWEVLPPGAFAEQGTNVNVALLTITAPA
jgi:phospholipid N-methyltransferase